MIKRMNRKGQSEGVGLGTILLILIGGGAVILIGLFYFGFFGSLEEGLKTFTPAQIDLKFNACSTYATPATIATFCRYEEIEKNTYLNCEYSEIETRLSQEGTDTSGLSCSETPEKFCEKVKEEKGESFNNLITVNGQTCYDRGFY